MPLNLLTEKSLLDGIRTEEFVRGAFLTSKGIVHAFITRSDSHDWTFWKACFTKAMTFVSKTLD
jgi:hypothetical protein